MLQVNIDRISYAAAIIAIQENLAKVSAFSPTAGTEKPAPVTVCSPASGACLVIEVDGHEMVMVARDHPEEDGYYFLFDGDVDRDWVEDVGTKNFDLLLEDQEWALDTLDHRRFEALKDHVHSELRDMGIPGVFVALTQSKGESLLMEGTQVYGSQVRKDDKGLIDRIRSSTKPPKIPGHLGDVLASLFGGADQDEESERDKEEKE